MTLNKVGFALAAVFALGSCGTDSSSNTPALAVDEGAGEPIEYALLNVDSLDGSGVRSVRLPTYVGVRIDLKSLRFATRVGTSEFYMGPATAEGDYCVVVVEPEAIVEGCDSLVDLQNKGGFLMLNPVRSAGIEGVLLVPPSIQVSQLSFANERLRVVGPATRFSVTDQGTDKLIIHTPSKLIEKPLRFQQ